MWGPHMKKTSFALSLLLAAAAAPCAALASEQLVPAGSLVQCMVAEPKLSSKTTAIGDPVLCRISHVELYGRSTFPYGSYLVGHFEDYKDPGHLVGKGWMELKFDRMVVQPDTVIPVSARVVAVPKYSVDKEGRILGKGHAVRDTIEWLIPVLWPVDLLNLPRRGPRPVLKAETVLTLKLMDDIGIPGREDAPRQRAALIERAQPPYAPQPYYAPPAAPQQVIYNQYAPQQAPIVQAPAVAQPVVIQPQVVYQYPAPRVIAPPYPYPPVAYRYGYAYPPAY